jgi:predicted house-cleaning noncanonical NTP pyrophosphatase (MazG superfamily)
MLHNKLVRDRIPEIIESKWQSAVTRILDKWEYLIELKRKLKEEVAEFLESKEDPEELADILEVLYALGEEWWNSKEELEKIRLDKAENRWWFKDMIYLVETN